MITAEDIATALVLLGLLSLALATNGIGWLDDAEDPDA